MLGFSWDKNKSQRNCVKHKISFEEAVTVFYDENVLLIDDPDHSETEERFVLIGLSTQLKVLTVCYCYHEDDKTIRIISARKATTHESKQYNEG